LIEVGLRRVFLLDFYQRNDLTIRGFCPEAADMMLPSEVVRHGHKLSTPQAKLSPSRHTKQTMTRMTLSTTSSIASKKRPLGMSKKRLSFHEIEIIEFPLTLGDSPSVHDGPPVSCGWDAQMRVKVNLDLFEQYRPKRRPRNNLVLSRQSRERILMKHGVSQGAILQATVEAMHARSQTTLCQLSRQRERTATMKLEVPTASALLETFAW
jgi:hypothetical protein